MLQNLSRLFWVSPGLTRQHTFHISFPGICLGSPRLHIVRNLFIPAHEAKMHPRARHPDHGHSRANVLAGQNPEMPTRGKDDCCQSCSWFCWVSLGFPRQHTLHFSVCIGSAILFPNDETFFLWQRLVHLESSAVALIEANDMSPGGNTAAFALNLNTGLLCVQTCGFCDV